METAKQKMASMSKKYGAGTVIKATTTTKIDRLPTGIFPLDLLLGGGIPRRKFTMIVGPNASNKCHAPGTKILMYDGTMKKVEDIQPGDVLMGPDSKPRNVVQSGKGYGQLYRIVPVFGDSFVVNDEHILCLRRTAPGSKRLQGEQVHVTVKDWINWSRTRKSMYALWRPDGIDLPGREVPLDPYFLGLWLGDGSSACSSITTGDVEIEEYLQKFAQNNGWKVSVHAEYEGCKTLAVVGHVKGAGVGTKDSLTRPVVVRDLLETVGVLNNKHVPDLYLRNNREVRAAVLAGLLDADGGLQGGTASMMFGNTNERLVEAVVYLSRSLGFRAVKKTRTQIVNGKAYESGYVYLTGDFSKLPMKIERKIPLPVNGKKDRLATGFRVEDAGEGVFYGFQLDGDHLYMAEDFIVHHNTNVCLKLIASHQRLYPELVCAFVDIEDTFDPVWAAIMGVDVESLILIKPDFAEMAVDITTDLVEAEDIGLIVIDSLGAMMSTKEIENSAETMQVGGSALLISRFVKKLTALLSRAGKEDRNPTIVAINQVRTKIGAYGDPEGYPGGAAMLHGMSLILRLYGKAVNDSKVHADLPVFRETNVIVKKNKMRIVSQSGKFSMVMIEHDGLKVGEVDDWTTISNYLKDYGYLAKAENGKGWQMFDVNYPTLAACKEKVYGDLKFGDVVRKAIIQRVMKENGFDGE